MDLHGCTLVDELKDPAGIGPGGARICASWREEAVWVEDVEGIQYLVDLGCFGKGIYSRSRPAWKEEEETIEELEEVDLEEQRSLFHRKRRKLGDERDGRDPSRRGKAVEPLQLAPEEVIYLAKDLNHPFVIDGVLVSVEELWKKMMFVSGRFFGLYFVYSHYRNAGWVPKCGLKFGTDLVLYFQGPETSHSRYAVSIDIVTESGEELPYCKNPHRSWLSFLGMNRVCGNAIKELVLCCVVVPNGLSQEDTFSMGVLESLKLKDYSFGRWNANKEN